MSVPGRNVLTVNLEDFYHSGALKGAVQPKHWDRLESRIDRALDATLGLLESRGVHATFFVFGMTAETRPDLVARIADAGHEIASRGYKPREMSGLDADAFRASLVRTHDALLAAGAPEVLGFRASPWLARDERWVLDVLADEGYRFDASVRPIGRDYAKAARRIAHVHTSPSGRTIRVYPVSTMGVLGMRVPFSGGTWLRVLPASVVLGAMHRWSQRRTAPLVVYAMAWELDPERPEIRAVGAYDRARLYRNAPRTREILEQILGELPFGSIAEHMGRPSECRRQGRRVAPHAITTTSALHEDAPTRPVDDGTPISVVVPLYNEEATLAYLERTLRQLRDRWAGQLDARFVLVDDGSRDSTWEGLTQRFGALDWCKLVRHERNRGVSAAIMTGIDAAETEICASIDGDCSYDPTILPGMVEALGDADMVTASPYHPEGSVHNVPDWRLFLSRNLSRLYSLVLRRRFFTYTSCCRVYRRSRVLAVPLTHDDFVGIAELLVRTVARGGRVIEMPATLESRILGASKMKTARTVGRHAAFVRGLVAERLFGGSDGTPVAGSLRRIP